MQVYAYESKKNNLGLVIGFKAVPILKFDGSDFIIKQRGHSIYYNLQVQGNYCYLFFADDPTLPEEKIIPFKRSEVFSFFYSDEKEQEFYWDDLEKFKDEEFLVIENESKTPEDFNFEIEILETETTGTGIFIDLLNFGLLEQLNDFTFVVETFKLEQFPMFPTSKKRITSEKTKLLFDGLFIPYVFEKDLIYKITVYLQPYDTLVKQKQVVRTKTLIPLKPTKFFCSKEYIESVANDFELVLKLPEDFFEVQKLIWRLSEKAFSISNLSPESLSNLTSDELIVFADFVSMKFLLNKLLGKILEQNVKTPEQESNGAYYLRLGDLQVRDAETEGRSMRAKTQALQALSTEQEKLLKLLSQNRAFKTLEINKIVQTKSSLLFPHKKSFIKTNAPMSWRLFDKRW